MVFKWEVIPVERLIDRVSELMTLYPNLMGGAADRHPYTPTTNSLRELTHGRIMPVEYRGHANIQFHRDEFENIDYVQANRTILIDGLVGAIRRKHIIFADYRQYEGAILEHLKDMVRIEDPDVPARWEKITGNDHFFHALAFLHASLKIAEIQFLLTSSTLNTMTDFVGVPNIHQTSPLGVRRQSR